MNDEKLICLPIKEIIVLVEKIADSKLTRRTKNEESASIFFVKENEFAFIFFVKIKIPINTMTASMENIFRGSSAIVLRGRKNTGVKKTRTRIRSRLILVRIGVCIIYSKFIINYSKYSKNKEKPTGLLWVFHFCS